MTAPPPAKLLAPAESTPRALRGPSAERSTDTSVALARPWSVVLTHTRVLACSLLLTSLIAARNDYALPRSHAFSLFALYGVYMAASVAFELDRG